MTSKFKPTYLYIKQHSVTGKLYFGKTTKDPERYNGSGLHWKSHIKKHGAEYVETLWYCLFLDKNSLSEFALNFSKQENITQSEDWLNLKPENGLDGGSFHQSKSSREKNSKSHLGRKHSKETLEKFKHRKSGTLGKPVSEETKAKISMANKGRKRPDVAERNRLLKTKSQ